MKQKIDKPQEKSKAKLVSLKREAKLINFQLDWSRKKGVVGGAA